MSDQAECFELNSLAGQLAVGEEGRGRQGGVLLLFIFNLFI